MWKQFTYRTRNKGKKSLGSAYWAFQRTPCCFAACGLCRWYSCLSKYCPRFSTAKPVGGYKTSCTTESGIMLKHSTAKLSKLSCNATLLQATCIERRRLPAYLKFSPLLPLLLFFFLMLSFYLWVNVVRSYAFAWLSVFIWQVSFPLF